MAPAEMRGRNFQRLDLPQRSDQRGLLKLTQTVNQALIRAN